MKKVGKILKWIPPVFFALLMFAGGAASILFLMAALLTLPIPKLQQFKKEKLRIGTGLTVLLSVVLFVTGVMQLTAEILICRIDNELISLICVVFEAVIQIIIHDRRAGTKRNHTFKIRK